MFVLLYIILILNLLYRAVVFLCIGCFFVWKKQKNKRCKEIPPPVLEAMLDTLVRDKYLFLNKLSHLFLYILWYNFMITHWKSSPLLLWFCFFVNKQKKKNTGAKPHPVLEAMLDTLVARRVSIAKYSNNDLGVLKLLIFKYIYPAIHFLKFYPICVKHCINSRGDERLSFFYVLLFIKQKKRKTLIIYVRCKKF